MTSEQRIGVAKCANCSTVAIPPAHVCRGCGSTELETAFVPGRGRIHTYTVIRIAPEAFAEEAPYPIAVVELAGDLRVTARLLQPADKAITIGQEVVFDHTDECGHWFRTAP